MNLTRIKNIILFRFEFVKEEFGSMFRLPSTVHISFSQHNNDLLQSHYNFINFNYAFQQ